MVRSQKKEKNQRRKTRCLHIPPAMSGRTASPFGHRKANSNSNFSLFLSQIIHHSLADGISAITRDPAAPVRIRRMKFPLTLKLQDAQWVKKHPFRLLL